MRPYDAILKFGDDAAYKRFQAAANARLQEEAIPLYKGYAKDSSQIKPTRANGGLCGQRDHDAHGQT